MPIQVATNIVKLARPTRDFERCRSFYCDGLGFEYLGLYADGDSNCCIRVAPSAYADWCLEFSLQPDAQFSREHDEGELFTLYWPGPSSYLEAIDRMIEHGHYPTVTRKPSKQGLRATFIDYDGHRVSIASEHTKDVAQSPKEPGDPFEFLDDEADLLWKSKVDGKCNCGRIAARMYLSCHPSELEVRACSCSFCRAHGASTAADPSGLLKLIISDCEPSYYQFGADEAAAVNCPKCGVFAAIVTYGGDGELIGTINTCGLGMRREEHRSPIIVNYSRESPSEKLSRRSRTWMPVVLCNSKTWRFGSKAL